MNEQSRIDRIAFLKQQIIACDAIILKYELKIKRYEAELEELQNE